jgi:hypothetical protein
MPSTCAGAAPRLTIDRAWKIDYRPASRHIRRRPTHLLLVARDRVVGDHFQHPPRRLGEELHARRHQAQAHLRTSQPAGERAGCSAVGVNTAGIRWSNATTATQCLAVLGAVSGPLDSPCSQLQLHLQLGSRAWSFTRTQSEPATTIYARLTIGAYLARHLCTVGAAPLDVRLCARPAPPCVALRAPTTAHPRLSLSAGWLMTPRGAALAGGWVQVWLKIGYRDRTCTTENASIAPSICRSTHRR